MNGEFPVQELRNKGIGDDMIAVLKKSMAPIVKERYKSVREFVEALPKVSKSFKPTVNDESTTIDEPKEMRGDKAGNRGGKLKLALIIPAVAVIAFGLFYLLFSQNSNDRELYWDALRNGDLGVMETLANKGYSDACNKIGQWYYNSTGPINVADIDEARIWFEKGAKLGDCSSAYDAAQIYEQMAKRAYATDSTGFGDAENLWNLAEEYYELALENLREMDNGNNAPRNNISGSFSHYDKEKIEEELEDCRNRR